MATGSDLSTLRISVADMIALQIRSTRPGRPAPPNRLYQPLPITAMSLMATIPQGSFEVSIPHQSELDCAYPILSSPHAAGDGFEIAYGVQANKRYEAVEILFQERKFSVEEFHNTACIWVEEHDGGLRMIPDRYAYFAPGIERWSAILRDSGYLALNPLKLPAEITAEMRQHRDLPTGSGIIARVPMHAGKRRGDGEALPVFARVALTLDSHPGPKSTWISFPEYQEMRVLLSRPPSSIIADFREWLKLLAAESGFKHFVFQTGMLFGDCIEWWGDRNRRRTVHEGLDFAEGFNPDKEVRSIPEATPVRAIADGIRVSILDDFLGKTVVVKHPVFTNEHGDVFYTLYSHIQPVDESSGSVKKGQLLGRVNKSTRARTPGHLHLTGAWIPGILSPDAIRMEHISPGFAPVILADFNSLLGF